MLRRLDRGYAASLEPGLDTLSLLRLYGFDRTGGMRYVTACLKALQKGENGSPTTEILGNPASSVADSRKEDSRYSLFVTQPRACLM